MYYDALRDQSLSLSASFVYVALFALEACRVGRVYRTRRRSHRRRRRRRRRRFGIPAFPYETNGMHKYFR